MPTWLLTAGWLAITLTAILAGRLIWEQTVLTWRSGPQMVGFSLVHGTAAALVTAPMLLAVWVAGALLLIGIGRARNRRASADSWLAVAVALAVLGALFIPEGIWNRVFVERLARSPHAAEFVIEAALAGRLGTVDALLTRGVPLETVNDAGQTALGAAAFGGQLRIVEYLVAKGANVNAIDHYGDSPLYRAQSEHHDSVARFLAQHGARLQHGSSEQLNAEAQRQVEESSKRLDAIMPGTRRNPDSAATSEPRR